MCSPGDGDRCKGELSGKKKTSKFEYIEWERTEGRACWDKRMRLEGEKRNGN
jgi:hypothetical protein